MRTIIISGMLLLCPFLHLHAQPAGVSQAEDLWGTTIPFGRIIRSPQTTIIQPFSASNCGYCLIDGWFVEKNYFETNRTKGGSNFTLSLFNPQQDNYAFTKHYRDTLTPVLTWPPDLYRYHEDGFPAILAFRNGEQVVKIPEGSLYPYDSSFEKLKMTLWNDTSVHFQPVSELHFATRIIDENMNYTATCVVADGNQMAFDRNSEFALKARCYHVKYLGQFTPGDGRKNILLEGKFGREVYRNLTQGQSPFRMEGDSILCLGRYRFGVDTIGISAGFPNPMNPEKYLVCHIRGLKVEKGFFDNSVDYTIYTCDSHSKTTRILIHGFFAKHPGNRWIFADSLCFSLLKAGEAIENCVGICKLPDKKYFAEHPVKIAKPRVRKNSHGDEYTFGNKACRFPSIATDDKGTAWVCWEEQGDILLSSVDRENPVSIAVEHDHSDSYNPLVTFADGRLWVFYLNNRDGFYRVYGRSFDQRVLGEPVLCSEVLPCDAVTPAMVSSKNGITLAWTYWKANFRFPFYRLIRNGIPDTVHAISAAESASLPGYVNSWYVSLTADASGKVWGAWNQHYPAILGVCSGNLDGKAIPVTRVTDDVENCENGGYPSGLHDASGRRWVFWESSSWGVPHGEKQTIRYSVFDTLTGAWSPSAAIPKDENTILNQTPQAVCAENGKIYLTWSGRTQEGDWALYMAIREKDSWTRPIRLTSGSEPARAPKIIPGQNNSIWVACHSGKGTKMKVKVFRLKED